MARTSWERSAAQRAARRACRRRWCPAGERHDEPLAGEDEGAVDRCRGAARSRRRRPAAVGSRPGDERVAGRLPTAEVAPADAARTSPRASEGGRLQDRVVDGGRPHGGIGRLERRRATGDTFADAAQDVRRGGRQRLEDGPPLPEEDAGVPGHRRGACHERHGRVGWRLLDEAGDGTGAGLGSLAAGDHVAVARLGSGRCDPQRDERPVGCGRDRGRPGEDATKLRHIGDEMVRGQDRHDLVLAPVEGQGGERDGGSGVATGGLGQHVSREDLRQLGPDQLHVATVRHHRHVVRAAESRQDALEGVPQEGPLAEQGQERLGRSGRESGHRRVPPPPARITAYIGRPAGAPAPAGRTPRRASPPCRSAPREGRGPRGPKCPYAAVWR